MILAPSDLPVATSRIVLDDRSGFKWLLWKSLEEFNPAYEEKEEELKQVNRGRGRPPKAPEFSGSLLWLVNPFEAVGSNSLST